MPGRTATQMIAQYLAIAAAKPLPAFLLAVVAADRYRVYKEHLQDLQAVAETGAVSIVGERGPELFVPVLDRIVSNRDSNAAMGVTTPAMHAALKVAMTGGQESHELGDRQRHTGNTLVFEGTNYVTRKFQAGVSDAVGR